MQSFFLHITKTDQTAWMHRLIGVFKMFGAHVKSRFSYVIVQIEIVR